MESFNFTEATIRQFATAESFRRGEEYYEQGAVISMIRRGNVLQAEVEGSQYEPYQVRVTFDAAGIAEAGCTCPYDWGGWCKHIVATLLAALDEPEEIEERPPVAEMLARLNRDQLQALVLKLVERHPDLTDWIEGQVTTVQSTPAEAAGGTSQPHQRQTPIDTAAIRRQVRYALRSLDRMRDSEAYWHVGEVVDEVGQVLDQAWAFVEAGDGRNALAVLEALTEEYVADWTVLDDSDGEASGFFQDLGPAWTEAILTADLTSEEREAWAGKLAQWQRELDNYGLDNVFAAAQAAAEQGWDYEPLQRVFQGEITERGAWEGEAPWYADDLAEARLNVLARQGRYQEYLYLAEAEGQTERYVTMLAQLGRTQEAVEYGLQYLALTDEALALAQALREQGKIAEALRIAEHGLTLQGQKVLLARWLRDTAAGAGQIERALSAAITAFRESPSLADYQAAQAVAGKRWPELRGELLDHLRQTEKYLPQARVEIFLHEGLIEDAIAAVDAHPAYYTLFEQVVDAAWRSHPDWAIRACRQQAEMIMDKWQSKYYSNAVRWLEKARAAYRAAGREAEWQTYLNELLARHGRKYSLVPMLQGLRK